MNHFTPLTELELSRWLAMDLLLPPAMTLFWSVFFQLIARHKRQKDILGTQDEVAHKPWNKLAENYFFIIVITVVAIAFSHWRSVGP